MVSAVIGGLPASACEDLEIGGDVVLALASLEVGDEQEDVRRPSSTGNTFLCK